MFSGPGLTSTHQTSTQISENNPSKKKKLHNRTKWAKIKIKEAKTGQVAAKDQMNL